MEACLHVNLSNFGGLRNLLVNIFSNNPVGAFGKCGYLELVPLFILKMYVNYVRSNILRKFR